MGKKVSECCDQWNDLQTMALADKMDVDAFKPSLNNCSSLDDYELKVRNGVEDNIDQCRSEFGELDPNNTVQLMAIAALDCVDVDAIVKAIMGFYRPQLCVLSLEKRVNKLYNRFVESKSRVNERETTPAHDGEIAAFDIKTKFDKDDLDVDSEVDVKNKKDAWILRLIYNDGNKENLSMVKPNDDKDDYVMTSDKDKLKVKFSDDPDDGTLNVPQTVIDHIAKQIEQAEKNAENDKKNNDSDLAHEIAYDIKKEFPNYDMEVIEGDAGSNKWSIEIVYKNGNKDHFVITKIGKIYIMRSDDSFISKFTLDELKNFPKKLKSHIEDHVKEAK